MAVIPRRPTLAARTLTRLADVPSWVRWVLPLLVWCAGATLLSVVPTTEGPPLPPLQAGYVAVQLFVLSPHGYPTEPASLAGAALWLVMLTAPALTATALADFVRRHLLSPSALVRGLSDHVLVCGLGDHGHAVVERALARGLAVVALDTNRGILAEPLPGQRLHFIQGDMTDSATLLAAGVDRAGHVFLCAGDPLANLDAGSAARAASGSVADGGPRLHILVDEMDSMSALLGPLGLEPTELVDQFAVSAKALVGSDTVGDGLARLHRGARPTRIALVGFGRFGQAVLRVLLDHPGLPRDDVTLVVVDRKGAIRLGGFEAQAAALGIRLEVAASADVETWTAEIAAGGEERRPGIVFLCVDNDPLALRSAALLRSAVHDVVVVVRVARRLNSDGDARFLPCSVPDLFASTVDGLLS